MIEAFVKLFESWVKSHNASSLSDYLLYAVAGLVGGAVLTLVSNPTLALPKRVGDRIKLGFIGTLLGGALWGIVADHSVAISILAGMLGPTVLVFVIDRALPALLVAVLGMFKKELGDK